MTHHSEQPPRFNVAVLYPSTNGPVREIARGILAASEETDSENYLRCDYFAASQLDSAAQQQAIETLLRNNPQLIISVGEGHTSALITHLNARQGESDVHGKKTPLICTATDGLTIKIEVDKEKEAAQLKARAESKKPLLQEDPVVVRHLHDLVASYHGPAMALERGDLDQQQMIRALLTLHPAARRILVPFADDARGVGKATFERFQRAAAMLPNPLWEEREKRREKELNQALREGDDEKYELLQTKFEAERREEKKQQQGKPYCSLVPLPIALDALSSLPTRLNEALKADKKIAAVATLEDYLLGDVSTAITKVCTARNVLFFGSSTAAVHAGAVAGFGGSYATLGRECFAAAYDHLVQKKEIKLSCSRHIAITREPLCNAAGCRALDLKEQYLQNFLHLPRVTTIESS